MLMVLFTAQYWLPPDTAVTPGAPVDSNACEVDVPQCDNQYNDSFFFTNIVTQFVPYSFGAMVPYPTRAHAHIHTCATHASFIDLTLTCHAGMGPGRA